MPGGDVATAWRMRALEAAGGLAWWAADVPGAHAHYEGQLALARALGNQLGIADASFNLIHTHVVLHPEDTAAQEALRAEAGAIYRELGNDLQLARLTWTTAYPLAFAGRSARSPGRHRRDTRRVRASAKTTSTSPWCRRRWAASR